MNDAWGYDENQNDNVGNGPKPLRDAYEAQKSKVNDLETKLAALEAAVQRNAIADLVESQGVARAAAKFYNGDADPEKVTSWVNDMRTTFGGAAPQETAPVQPAISPNDQNDWQRMNEAGSNGAPAGNFDMAKQALSNATSTEERIAALAQFQRGGQ